MDFKWVRKCSRDILPHQGSGFKCFLTRQTGTFKSYWYILGLGCVLNNICLNGATCQEVDGTNVSCLCPTGFTGERCETSKALEVCFANNHYVWLVQSFLGYILMWIQIQKTVTPNILYKFGILKLQSCVHHIHVITFLIG